MYTYFWPQANNSSNLLDNGEEARQRRWLRFSITFTLSVCVLRTAIDHWALISVKPAHYLSQDAKCYKRKWHLLQDQLAGVSLVRFPKTQAGSE